MTLLERFHDHDIRALSRLITFVENREEGFRQLLGRLYPKTGGALRIGVTGPPGAGKSTLVNGLTKELLREGRTIGIIAVDPTSPFTGGALLGDRVRMNELPSDGRVFFRSMATRGATGGLAAATDNVAVLYDAYGFDFVLIETVGVGQVEMDIINACDVVVVVIVPESGDAIQMLKAGLTEIADVFCINKSDRPGAQRLAADLKYTLELRGSSQPAASTARFAHTLLPCAGHEHGHKPAVVQTEATTGKNVDALHRAIGEFIKRGHETSTFEQRRRQRLCAKITEILNVRFQSEFVNHVAGEQDILGEIDNIIAGQTNPYEVGDRLYRRFREQ